MLGQFPIHYQIMNRLISFWDMEEATGNRIDAAPTNSLKTAANNLTPNGTPTNAPGKIGNALSVIPQQTVSIASNSSLAIATGESFSIALWVNLAAKPTTAARIVQKIPTGTNIMEYTIRYVASINQFGFILNDSTGMHQSIVNDTTSVSTGTWYFIAVSFDNPNNLMSISVNNNTPSTGPFSFEVNPGGGNFIIGGTDTVTQFFVNGLIDAVGFWKRVLTAQEIKYLYNNGNGRQFPFAA